MFNKKRQWRNINRKEKYNSEIKKILSRRRIEKSMWVSESSTRCGIRCDTWCDTRCDTWCGTRCGTRCGSRCDTWCGTLCGTRCDTWCGTRCVLCVVTYFFSRVNVYQWKWIFRWFEVPFKSQTVQSHWFVNNKQGQELINLGFILYKGAL